MITDSGVYHEFRTTLIASLLTRKDILKIASLIPSSQKYVLQKFVPSKLLDNNFRKDVTFGENEINDIKSQLEKRLSFVMTR